MQKMRYPLIKFIRYLITVAKRLNSKPHKNSRDDFHHQKNKINSTSLHINNEEIAASDEVKYLWIHIDNSLRFAKQGDTMLSSACKL